MQIRAFRESDQQAVIDLWTKAGLTRPWNNPQADIRRKLKVQPQWFLVAVLEHRIIASIMAGYDGHRGWVNYLAVDPQHQGTGIGRKMMDHVQRLLTEFGCPKINIQVRNDNAGAINFYKKIGYVEDEVVSLGKRLIVDD